MSISSTGKRITITDVARESGFSESTVSLVLNSSPKISEETRSKVLATIEKFGYRPNIQARGLALKSSRVVSVVVPDIPHVLADGYFGEIISGICSQASESGYKMLVDIADLKFVRTQEHISLLATQRADGMLFVGSTLYDTYLSVFQEERHPFILVNHYFPNQKLNSIAMDFRESARKSAAHLLSLGHKVIGSIQGTNIQTFIDFHDEFTKCLAQAGIPESAMPWSDGRFGEASGFDAARVLFTLNPDITAIVCGNERMAAGALRFLQGKGLRVPQDVSLMCIEDVPSSIWISPKLTSVRHNLYELGAACCKSVIALSRGEIKQITRLLPVELIQRESTGPAPKKS